MRSGSERVKTGNLLVARENACVHIRIGVSFETNWWSKSFLYISQSKVMQTKSNPGLLIQYHISLV